MSKVLDPVADYERHFSSSVFSALWANWGFSLLAILMGARLTAPRALGGLGLGLAQVALIAPPALILGGLVVAVVSKTAFESGLNTGMLFRPAFGIAGSWLMSSLVAFAYLIWMALELRVSGGVIVAVFESTGMALDILIPISILGAVVGMLSYVGLRRFAARVVQPILIWISSGLFLFGFVWLMQQELAFFDVRAPTGELFVAAQQIVLYVVVFLPLVADTSRFAGRSNYAVSAPGVAFMLTLAASMTVGTLLGAIGTAPFSGGVAQVFIGSGSIAVTAAVVGWVLAAEVVQPYGFLYAASNAASSVFLRRPPRSLGWVVVLGAALMAAVFTERQLFPVAEVATFVLAPAFAVVVIDYFLVRRRQYLVDEMYDRSGTYGGVNLIGLFAFVVGLFVGYVIDPLGPEVFLRGVEVAMPFAGSWSDTAPALFLSVGATALVYGTIGRLRIAQSDVVSKVRI